MTQIELSIPEKKSNIPNRTHPFHLVEPSSLPILVSIASFFLLFNFVVWLHPNYFLAQNAFTYLFLSFGFLVYLMFVWFKNIIVEKYLNFHTEKVKKGLKLGFAFFILSEVMFFFAFFWAYLYNALSPSIWIGGIWPPFAIEAFNPFSLPLANTGLSLTSGVTVTASHLFMEIYKYKEAKFSLLLTLLLAFVFLFVQNYEFKNAPFSISDGIYGSTFYMITGLHGAHVIIGGIFLYVCYIRYRVPELKVTDILNLSNDLQLKAANTGGHLFFFYTSLMGTGFITGSWYWHFVDVVWIYVYIFLYLFSFF